MFLLPSVRTAHGRGRSRYPPDMRQILDGYLGLRQLAALALVTTLSAWIAGRSSEPGDDCPIPTLRLAGVVKTAGMRPAALMMDSERQGHVVHVGDWIAGALAVHVDADSVTLAPNARCTVRYE